MTATVVGIVIAWLVIDVLAALALGAFFRAAADEPEDEGYVSHGYRLRIESQGGSVVYDSRLSGGRR